MPANEQGGTQLSVALSQDCQPGKHRRHHCSRDGALELHLRAARRQVAR